MRKKRLHGPTLENARLNCPLVYKLYANHLGKQKIEDAKSIFLKVPESAECV